MKLSLYALSVLVVVALSGATARAESPDIGRCVSVGSKKGAYSNTTCTKVKSGGNFEWESGAAKPKFTGVGGEMQLQTISKDIIPCKGATLEGEYTSPRAATGRMTLTGCEILGYECRSAGAEAGEVRFNVLTGTLVWGDKEMKAAAMDFTPATGERFVEFQCGPFTPVIRGSLLVNVSVNTAQTSPELKFVEKVGVQKPDDFFTPLGEQVLAYAEVRFSPSAEFEQMGFDGTISLTYEEALEVNTVA